MQANPKPTLPHINKMSNVSLHLYLFMRKSIIKILMSSSGKADFKRIFMYESSISNTPKQHIMKIIIAERHPQPHALLNLFFEIVAPNPRRKNMHPNIITGAIAHINFNKNIITILFF